MIGPIVPASPPVGREQAETLYFMYCVYVLKSLKDGKLYYGFTNNLIERMKQHNNGEVKSTKSRIPFELIYFEKVSTLVDARKRERYFKSGFGRKYVKNKLK